jgi:hypothetical protein
MFSCADLKHFPSNSLLCGPTHTNEESNAHMHMQQMTTDMRAPAHLCALPNDILRAVAAFMPPSALLVIVRCSRHFSRVLHGEVTQRLDGLFQYVALPTASFSTSPDWVKLVEHSWPQHMPRLFVEAMLGTSDLHPGGYLFLEALKGYDGLREHSCRTILILSGLLYKTYLCQKPQSSTPL